MEQLIKSKSGIKIKPSHKGLFSSYCKGKVTSACIQKGKNSPNPVIRKRATFAQNVRHFKHKSGGQIRKALFGMEFGSGPWLKPAEQEYNDNLLWKRLQPVYKMFNGIQPHITAGILGNIALESSGFHNAKSGSYSGYIQNSPEIVSYIIKHYGDYGPNNQIQFILDGLNNKLPETKSSQGKELFNRFDEFNKGVINLINPEDVSDLWEKAYERSGKQGNSKRRYYSNKFYEFMKIPKKQEGGQINLGELAGQAYNSIMSGIQQTKADNAFKDYLKQKKKVTVDTNFINQQARINLNRLKQMNPDQNFGIIDLQQQQQKLAANAYAQAQQKANEEIQNEWNKYQENKQSIQGSANDNIIGKFLGLGVNYLLNKKQPSTN